MTLIGRTLMPHGGRCLQACSLWPGGGGDGVVAEADQRGLGLDRASSEQDLLTPVRVGPLLAQRPSSRVQSGAEVGCEHQPVLAVIWLVLMVAALATLGVGQPQWWWSWQLKSYRIH